MLQGLRSAGSLKLWLFASHRTRWFDVPTILLSPVVTFAVFWTQLDWSSWDPNDTSPVPIFLLVFTFGAAPLTWLLLRGANLHLSLRHLFGLTAVPLFAAAFALTIEAGNHIWPSLLGNLTESGGASRRRGYAVLPFLIPAFIAGALWLLILKILDDFFWPDRRSEGQPE